MNVSNSSTSVRSETAEEVYQIIKRFDASTENPMLMDLYVPENCPFKWWNEKIENKENEFLVPIAKKVFVELTSQLASSFGFEMISTYGNQETRK